MELESNLVSPLNPFASSYWLLWENSHYIGWEDIHTVGGEGFRKSPNLGSFLLVYFSAKMTKIVTGVHPGKAKAAENTITHHCYQFLLHIIYS